MKFSSSLIVAYAAYMMSSVMADSSSDDCQTTRHVHHQHKRAVAVEYVYSTVTVNGKGEIIYPSTTAQESTTTSSSTVYTVLQSTSSPTSYYLTTTSSSSTTSTSTTSSTTSATTSTTSTTSDAATTTSSSTAAATTTASSSSGSSNGYYGDLSDYEGPYEEFTDGTIDCTDFDSLVGQGVISLSHLGFGGFSGIYHSDTSTGGTCTEGSYCSYACQPGMSKTQWPSSQPANGVSVGGLICTDGKLYRTRTSTSYLCEWGIDSAVVVSELSENVAVCRTDYPGTENMVIPTYVQAGGTEPLTVVDQDTYYTWQGLKTSAQYYVNKAGYTVEEACVWGTSGDDFGNWAPMNFGAGYTDGISYVSLIPNPNNYDYLGYNIKIVAYDSSSVVTGSCVYENGYYNGDGSDGCTVAVTSGRAAFVLYSS